MYSEHGIRLDTDNDWHSTAYVQVAVNTCRAMAVALMIKSFTPTLMPSSEQQRHCYISVAHPCQKVCQKWKYLKKLHHAILDEVCACILWVNILLLLYCTHSSASNKCKFGLQSIATDEILPQYWLWSVGFTSMVSQRQCWKQDLGNLRLKGRIVFIVNTAKIRVSRDYCKPLLSLIN